MGQVLVSRAIIAVLAAVLRVVDWLFGLKKIEDPPQISVHRALSDVDASTMALLTSVYTKIFSQEPWNLKWTQKVVEQKLIRESHGKAFCLSLLHGDAMNPVGGFLWSAIIPVNDIPMRYRLSWPEDEITDQEMQPLLKFLTSTGASHVFFIDDFGILPHFQGQETSHNAYYLVRPHVFMAAQHGVGCLLWTSTETKIFSIAKALGCELIFTVHGHQFFWSPPRNVRNGRVCMEKISGYSRLYYVLKIFFRKITAGKISKKEV